MVLSPNPLPEDCSSKRDSSPLDPATFLLLLLSPITTSTFTSSSSSSSESSQAAARPVDGREIGRGFVIGAEGIGRQPEVDAALGVVLG
jgi:hypothetical protein